MPNNDRHSAKSRVNFLLLLAIAITALLLWITRNFILAIFVAAVLAGITAPLNRRLAERMGGRKSAAAGLTVALSLLLVIVPLLLFAMILIGQAVETSESASQWAASQKGNIEGLRNQIEQDPTWQQLLPYQPEITAKASQLTSQMATFVAERVVVGAIGTARFFFMLSITLFAMFCFLKDGPAILEWTFRALPVSSADKDRFVATFISVSRATLKGTLLIGIVQGGLAGLAFWAVGIEGAVFWGAVMTLLSIIPAVGTALVWIPAVIWLALNGQIGAAIGVGLWCAIVVGMADNVLRPLVIGKDTKMPELLVMLTTLGGLATFGAVGIIIGPVIGALFIAIWELWSAAVENAQAGGQFEENCDERTSKNIK